MDTRQKKYKSFVLLQTQNIIAKADFYNRVVTNHTKTRENLSHLCSFVHFPFHDCEAPHLKMSPQSSSMILSATNHNGPCHPGHRHNKIQILNTVRRQTAQKILRMQIVCKFTFPNNIKDAHSIECKQNITYIHAFVRHTKRKNSKRGNGTIFSQKGHPWLHTLAATVNATAVQVFCVSRCAQACRTHHSRTFFQGFSHQVLRWPIPVAFCVAAMSQRRKTNGIGGNEESFSCVQQAPWCEKAQAFTRSKFTSDGDYKNNGM